MFDAKVVCFANLSEAEFQNHTSNKLGDDS